MIGGYTAPFPGLLKCGDFGRTLWGHLTRYYGDKEGVLLFKGDCN